MSSSLSSISDLSGAASSTSDSVTSANGSVALKIILLGGGVGAYSRLGAY